MWFARPEAHIFIIGLVLLLCVCSAASKTRSQGEIGLSARSFSPDDDPATLDYGLAADFHLDLKAKQGEGFRQQLRLTGRAGLIDEERSVLVVNDAWIGWRAWRLQVSIGAETLDWSTAEAFHPTDTINSRNLDSDLENPEKMGELMAKIRLRFYTGGLTAYYLPIRIAPRFPSVRSRLNFTRGQQLDQAKWSDPNGRVSEGRFATQYALRLDQTIGQTDVTAHYVVHNDRAAPSLLINPMTDRIAPTFPFVERMGGSLVTPLGDWLFKVEGEYRQYRTIKLTPELILAQPQTANHAAVAGGFDYGWTYENGSDATVLVEGQVLHSRDASSDGLGFVGPFQRDVLVGYRHAANDEDSTEFLVGIIADLEEPNEFIGTFTASRRLSNTWKLEGKYQFVNAPETDSLLHQQNGNHVAYLDLIRSF